MKQKIIYVSTFSEFLKHVREVFTKRNWPYAVALMTAMVIVTGRKTITNLIRAASLSRYFTGYYRFFEDYRWSEVKLARKVLEMIVECFGLGSVELAVDDTICQKKRAKTYGVSLYNKGSRGRFNSYQEGHNWVTVGLVLTSKDTEQKYFFPLLAGLYVRKEDLEDKEEFKTKFEIGGELVRRLVENLGISVVLAADGAYAQKPFLKELKKASVGFVGRLRKDARLYKPRPRKSHPGRKSKHGKRLPRLSYLFRGKQCKLIKVVAYGRMRKVKVREFLAYWPSVDGVIKAVAVKGMGKKPTLLFSTDIKMSAERIIEIYAGRWRIETGYRDAKQYMGFGQTQCTVKKAIIRYTVFTMLTQSMVQLWYLKKHGEQLPHEPDPWYQRKKLLSFQDMLMAVRAELKRNLISKVCIHALKMRFAAKTLINRINEVI